MALEGRSINASLYALGEVVRGLSSLVVGGGHPGGAHGKSASAKAPGALASATEPGRPRMRWRDTKLTRMMKGPLRCALSQ